MLNVLLRPRVIITVVVLALVAGGAWHYRHVIAKNAELTARVLELMGANESLETQLEAERRAAAIAIRERRMAQDALDALRTGQSADTDPEYLEWSGIRIPPTERARLCNALPRMAGCESR